MCSDPTENEAPLPDITLGTLQNLRSTLLNVSGSTSLAHRFRALFTLKALGKSNSVIPASSSDSKDLVVSDEVIQIISDGFKDESALLKHELAYVLGQIGNPKAVSELEEVLGDLKQDAMVRHEAAEALGALTSGSSELLLKKYLNDPEPCIRETCEIALARIEWAKSQKTAEKLEETPQFTSVDPAPPFPEFSPSSTPQSHTSSTATTTLTDISILAAILINPSISLFDRYRAMFSLRNIVGQHNPATEKAAVEALASGFSDPSELFKHEIAFVFGQLSTPHSIPSLLEVLKNDKEAPMVRHEAAEALGGIVDQPSPTEPSSEPVDVLAVLKEWSVKEDAPSVVRESCLVAIDMWQYENSKEFQYANGLETTTENLEVHV